MLLRNLNFTKNRIQHSVLFKVLLPHGISDPAGRGITFSKKAGIFFFFIIPSTFSPQTSSPLSHHRRTEKFQHPFHPYFFLFSTERAGPYPQVQL